MKKQVRISFLCWSNSFVQPHHCSLNTCHCTWSGRRLEYFLPNLKKKLLKKQKQMNTPRMMRSVGCFSCVVFHKWRVHVPVLQGATSWGSRGFPAQIILKLEVGNLNGAQHYPRASKAGRYNLINWETENKPRP